MRTIERRAGVGRRVFLQSSAAAAAAAGTLFSADAAWAQEAKTLSPHVMATLAKAARDIYPHDRIADIYYATAVAGYDKGAAKDADLRALVEGGVARLDSDATDRFSSKYIDLSWEADRVTVLQGVEATPFFRKLRSDLVVTFYNQKALWPRFGYEGSSADKGGYIHRGFNDIDWLADV